MFEIEVLFLVDLGHDHIQDQVVVAAGLSPSIRIQRVAESSIHFFGIAKRVPHHHPSVINAVIAEAERQIEPFLAILSHLMQQPLRPTGEIRYLHKGSSHTVTQAPHLDEKPTLGRGFSSKWFEQNAAVISEPYDLDLLKRFNFARFLADPVSRFTSLYQLLLSTEGDSQEKVDSALLEVDPTIERAKAPGRKAAETTFTRLRNEVSHHRFEASLVATHREIQLQIVRFTSLVEEVMKKRLRKTA